MSVKKRGNTWQVRLKVKDKNGIWVEKGKGGFKTKAEATIWESELILSLSQEKDNNKGDMLYTDYYDDWLEDHFKIVTEPSTQKNHHTSRKISGDYFKNVKISEITRQDFQRFVYHLSETRKPATVKQYMVRAGMPLKTAFHDGDIPSDPTYGVKVPNIKQKTESVKFLELDEIQTMINYFESHPWTKPMFVMFTILATGLRIGEVLALQISNVDTKNRTISVEHSREFTVPYGLGPTKTPSSVRTISAPDSFFVELERYKNEVGYASDEAIFGKHPTQSTYNTHLANLVVELGITPITSHHLRHTHGSYLILKGADIKYVSERLGHSSTKITEEIYVHLLSEQRKKEVKKMENYF